MKLIHIFFFISFTHLAVPCYGGGYNWASSHSLKIMEKSTLWPALTCGIKLRKNKALQTFFRHHTRIRDPIFCDTKIERAGGREIVSRSRSARHKRSSKSDSHNKRSSKNYDLESATKRPPDSISQTQQRNSLNSR